jgi:tRNA(Ile)-lysidine synthase TilS/MesJ
VIEEDAKAIVCLSGCEDFFVMLSLLMILQGNTLVKFEQVAVDIVQTLSHHQQHILPNY